MAEPAPVACTVVARRDLPAARVLSRSYLEHHPDHTFVVVVVDHTPGLNAGPGVRVVGPDWLDVDPSGFSRLATAYEAADLAATAIPFALRGALAEAPVAIYLEASIQVLAPLPEATTLARSHDIVLIPQLLEPLPADGRQPDATTMPTGAPFSLDFLAVSRQARPFLDHWAGWTTPQPGEPRPHPIQLVPGLYRHTVLRDPSCDVGYWNAHERTVTPRFVNFRGYDPDRPWLLSKRCEQRPRVLLSEHPTLRDRANGYRAALIEAGYPESDQDYGFDSLPDGSPLTATMRRLFRHAWAAAERDATQPTRHKAEQPPPAFDGDMFRTWLSEAGNQRERAAGLNRVATWVWENRPDLQVVFRHPYREDSEAFRTWCRDHGVAEGLIPDWAVPAAPPPPASPTPEFGVNLAGYLTGELGLGEMGRIVHRVLEHAGIPVASVVEERSLTCRTDLPEPEDTGTPRFPISILAVNADYTRLMVETYPEVAAGRYRIGLWAWELEDFPAWQHEAFAFVDEIWTVSEWCRTAIAAHSPVPVKTIPVPVLDPGESSRDLTEPIRFLFAFDFNSTGQRKNATGLITAFQRAFPGREDVRLVIKATNAELHPSEAERLRIMATDDRVQLLERYLSVRELDELYQRSHAYVSLHRSEGFGLTVAEAMIRSLPVISTDYSGTAEFVDETVGWPVPYRMVEVGPGARPYHEGARWADPDLDHAAAAMREIADNPAEASRRGKAAREHLLHTRSLAVAAEWMRTELTAAHRNWQRSSGLLRRGVNRLRRQAGR